MACRSDRLSLLGQKALGVSQRPLSLPAGKFLPSRHAGASGRPKPLILRSNETNEAYRKAIDLLLSIRQQAKQNKDWATSDRIRNEMATLGFVVKDTKDGFEWSL